MAWIRSQQTGLVELLEKLAKLHSKLSELHIKQKCTRAIYQAKMLQARISSEAPQEKKP